jgi:integrase
MASIKLRKNTWYAVWIQNGKQVVRTTNVKAKGAKEKKLAQTAADAMEGAAKGNIAVSSAIDALRKVAESIGLSSSMPSIKEYLQDYKPGGKEANARNYSRAVELFLKHLDVDAYRRLDLLTVAQCKAFLSAQLKRVAYGTVRHYYCMINAALNDAVREGLIDRNPMALAQLHKLYPEGEKRSTERLPFTMEEMRIIVNKFPYPWAQMALASYLTGGQRLGDIACLKWSSIDFSGKVIHIRTTKTGKAISAPLTPMLELALKPLMEDDSVYVFPSAARLHELSKGKLSIQFTALLRAHGIVTDSKQNLSGDRRPVSQKSFHSIRHTVVSEMRCNPLITADLSREIVGHDSETVERGYFTAPSQAKLDAFDFLCTQLAADSQG